VVLRRDDGVDQWAASSSLFSLTPSAYLEVGDVAISSIGVSGEPTTISWSVTNRGGGLPATETVWRR
jgi:hypothetical protein